MLTRKEQEKEQLARIGSLGLKRIICYDLEVEDTTLCMLFDPKHDWVPAKGLAIQSPDDQLDRREGRVRATARALRAFDRTSNSGKIATTRYEGFPANKRYDEIMKRYSFKSVYNPKLRSAEDEAVKEFKKKVANGGQ